MKKMLYVLLALFALAGCKEKEKKVLDITGDWQLKTVTVKATYGHETVDVYLRFAADQSFELYQMLGTGRYRVYTGKWTLTENVLTGSYSDGKKWGASYEVEVDGDTMTLTSVSEKPETDTYRRTTIPQDVIDTAE